MIVRGAPAIGVAAAMGVALGVRDLASRQPCRAAARFRPHLRGPGRYAAHRGQSLLGDPPHAETKFEGMSAQPIAEIKQELITEAQRM